MSDSNQIEFPCDYPLHIIGEQVDGFLDAVLAIVRAGVDELDEASVSLRHSRAGNYCAVRVTIVATGAAQIAALNRALLAEPAVRLVL